MENEAKIAENTDKLLRFIHDKFLNGELNNQSLVELLQLSGTYLNLQTIPQYAKINNMSYEGVKKGRKIETIFGVRFVIDNE